MSHKEKLLREACSQGSTYTVDELLQQKTDPNTRNEIGNCPLHLAILSNYDIEVKKNIVALLVQYGADVNLGNANRKSTLHLAAENGLVCMVKKLLENGADTHMRDNLGNSAFHAAIEKVNDPNAIEEIVTLLIEHGGDVNIANAKGRSPMHWAAGVRNHRVVKKLLENRADPNMKDNDGNAALHFATGTVQNDHNSLEQIVTLLMKHGADPNIRNSDGNSPLHLAVKPNEKIVALLIKYGCDVNVENKYGRVPLHTAAHEGKTCIVKKLLDAKANINARDQKECNALQFALIYLKREQNVKAEETVSLLVDRGANVNADNKFGMLPIITASEIGNAMIVKKLLEAGADPDKKNVYGATALAYAVLHNEDAAVIVRLLMKYGVDVNARNEYEHSPLHIAALKGDVCMVKKLMESKCIVNITNNMGQTPLHCAILRASSQPGIEEIVEHLIAFEADVNADYDDGFTSLHVASGLGRMSIVVKLLRHGSDPNAMDRKGKTPLHEAVRFKHEEIAEFLIEHGADPEKRDGFCQPAAISLQQVVKQRRGESQDGLPDQPMAIPFDVRAFNGADEGDFHELETILLEIHEQLPDLFNNCKDGFNFLLTWLSMCNHMFRAEIPRKLTFLLNHTEDRNQRDRHGRNFLHLYILTIHEVSDEFSRTLCGVLTDSMEKYIDASLVNAEDHNGWTPAHLLFYSLEILMRKVGDATGSRFLKEDYTRLMKTFLKSGLDTRQTDHHGVSLVHCAAATGMLEVLQLLLETCEEEFVNRKDRFGSTALHYAVISNCTETTQCLLEKGGRRDIKDHEGRTAGDLAKLLGYGERLHQLERGTVSLNPDIFDCKDEHQVYRKPVSVDMDYSRISDAMKEEFGQTSIETVYESLLKSPVLGSREYQAECFATEAHLVKHEFVSLMTSLSKQHGQQFPLFAFEPRLRGSMAEGTKCGPPDEFDCMLIMNTFAKDCQLEAIHNCKAELTKAGLPLKTYAMCEEFLLSIKMVVLQSALWNESPLKFVNFERMKVGGCLNLVFTGHVYKSLHISVDLVPCIPLGIQSDVIVRLAWPYVLDFSKCQLYGLFRFGYDNFDLSSTDYEEVILHSLPSAAKDAYVLGKAFGSTYFNWCGRKFGKSFKPSYTMKKALLLSSRKHADMQQVSRQSWLEGFISTGTNMHQTETKKVCRRCIFHSEKWIRGEHKLINLSF